MMTSRDSLRSRPSTYRQLRLALRADWKRVTVMLLVIAAYCMVWARYGRSEERAAIWDFVDTGLKLGTLAIAFLLWIRQSYNDWEDRRPKRLFVEFLLAGNPVLRAEQVPLLDEGDIRQWSQQVGAQMVGGRNLKFSLDIGHWTHVVDSPDPARSCKCYTKLPE